MKMFRKLLLVVLLVLIVLPSSLVKGQDECDLEALRAVYSEAFATAESLQALDALQSQMGEAIAACLELESADETTADDLILNVAVKQSGIEVFPEPDRSSGREFAASGDFAPHVAGRNEDGTFIYIYYFDSGLQDGWSPVNQFAALTDQEIDGLAVIDPDSPPDLPNLPYDQHAARPFGTASTASDNHSATGVAAPVGSPGSPPIIVDTFVNGSCDNITLSVLWSDADSDASEAVLLGGSLGRVAVSGSSGTAVFGDLYCDFESCTFDAEVFDRAGNRSGPRSGTGWCSQ
jgi:hypothetical protein